MALIGAYRHRHRRVYRNSINGISIPDIRRLARRGGVVRASGRVYEESKGVLRTWLRNIIRDATIYVDHGHRSTMSVRDVMLALEHNGYVLYGPDGREKKMKKAGGGEGSKGRRPRVETFASSIYKVLKQVHPDTSISKKAMTIMNQFVLHMLDKLAHEASILMSESKASTMTLRVMEMATRLLLNGQLIPHAVSEGRKAVERFLA